MSILDTIFGGNLGRLFKDVVGTFKLSPEKKAEFEAVVEAHAHELATKQAELEARIAEFQAREIEAASANIRAEAQSGDKYTSRARPTFLYLMYLLLFWNYLLLPLVQYFGGRPLAPINFPDALMWLMGSGYLGYAGARGWDKYLKEAKNGDSHA